MIRLILAVIIASMLASGTSILIDTKINLYKTLKQKILYFIMLYLLAVLYLICSVYLVNSLI